MNTLEINGRTFKKAGDIAREFGYTSDYVGQLCRAGKVDAQLVGRSWYVDVNSLTEHKQTRYRSNAEKTKQAVEREIKATLKKEGQSEQSEQQGRNPYKQSYLRHASKLSVKVPSYEEDAAELLPSVRKPASKQTVTQTKPVEIEVVPDGQEKLPVDSKTSNYRMKSTKKPKVGFTGTVAVSSAESDYEEAETPLPEVPSTNLTHPPIAPKETAKQLKTKPAAPKLSQLQRARKLEITDASTRRVMSLSRVIASLIITAIVATGVAVAGIGLQGQVTATAQETVTDYSFDTQRILSLLAI